MHPKFAPADNAGDGFDGDASADWLMMPEDSKRRPYLWNASTMHVRSLDPGTVKIKFVDDNETFHSRRQVILESWASGSTDIEVVLYNHVKTRLHVKVYPEREVKLNFYGAVDKNGDAAPFNPATVREVLNRLNQVYVPQANLSFQSHRVVGNVPVNFDFRTQNRSPDNLRQMWLSMARQAVKLDPAPRHYHVFWLKSYHVEDVKHWLPWVKTDHIAGEAPLLGARLCFMEHQANAVDQSLLLAHELGHCLGADHDEKHHDSVMHPNAYQARKLYRKTVEEIRGSTPTYLR